MFQPSITAINRTKLQIMMLLIAICASFDLKLLNPLPSNKGS